MKKGNIIYSVFALFLLACNPSPNLLENNTVEQRLSQVQIDTPFSLDTLNRVDWDTLFIVKPYSFADLDKHNLQIPKEIKQDLETNSIANEGLCVLLFIKDHKLVNYARIPRTTSADFAFIDKANNGMAANTTFMISDSSRTIQIYEEHFK